MIQICFCLMKFPKYNVFFGCPAKIFHVNSLNKCFMEENMHFVRAFIIDHNTAKKKKINGGNGLNFAGAVMGLLV